MNENIIKLINYELKYKHYNISVDDKFFDNFDSNFKEADVFKQEIMISISDHYSFLNNEVCLKKFIEILNLMKILFETILDKDSNNFRILKENDPLLITLWSFYQKKIELISTFYAVIILKSTVISNFDKKNKYENSDIILDRIVEYWEKFLIFFEKNSIIFDFFEPREIRTHFFLIYEYLIKSKAINHKLVWKKKEDKLVSEKFWGIEDLSYISCINNFNIFLHKPIIKIYNKKHYLVGGYYNKIFNIFRKNINSGLSFELNDDQYLNDLNDLEWYIDLKWYENILNIIKNKENFYYEEEKQKLIQTIVDLNNCEWKNIELQKEYSKSMFYINIWEFFSYIKKLNNDNPIFFPFYFDFRGRIYYDSSVGITSCKLLRTIYYYGTYEKKESLKEIDDRFEVLLNRYESYLSFIKEYFSIKENSKKLNINLILILISIGKFTIDKNKWQTHMDIFIENAVFLIKNDFNRILKLEDYIEAKSYENILINYMDNKKRIIIKDFTASFFQHLSRLLGPKKEDTLKLANMLNDLNWNDPYTYFISKFLEKNNNLKFNHLFNRSLLKKTIMTIPYSIGNKSAWNYFCENLEQKDILNKELRKEYNLFFKFIKKQLDDNEFFINSTDRIILYAITKSWWFQKFQIKLGKSSVHLIYYKSKTKILDLTIKVNKKTMRITKKINVIDYKNIDYENISISVRANWIAMMDGDALRVITKILRRRLFTVHDCLLIDWLNNDELIIACNEALKENNLDEITWDNSHSYIIFSFFVIL